jgi:hypothetical protein
MNFVIAVQWQENFYIKNLILCNFFFATAVSLIDWSDSRNLIVSCIILSKFHWENRSQILQIGLGRKPWEIRYEGFVNDFINKIVSDPTRSDRFTLMLRKTIAIKTSAVTESFWHTCLFRLTCLFLDKYLMKTYFGYMLATSILKLPYNEMKNLC